MECSECQYGMYPYDEPLSSNAIACPRCGEPLGKEDNESQSNEALVDQEWQDYCYNEDQKELESMRE